MAAHRGHDEWPRAVPLQLAHDGSRDFGDARDAAASDSDGNRALRPIDSVQRFPNGSIHIVERGSAWQVLLHECDLGQPDRFEHRTKLGRHGREIDERLVSGGVGALAGQNLDDGIDEGEARLARP